MKKLMSLIVSVVFLFLQVPKISALEVAQVPESIMRLDSDITINQDTSLSITEKIIYFTPEDKHGIYRYIPEKYRRNGSIVSNQVFDISVKDLTGRNIPFQSNRGDGNLTLKIGDPEITFTGAKIYVISYRVTKAVLKQKDFDELYWDITGEGWKFPIGAASVTVHSPFAKVTETKCFTGAFGSTESDCDQGLIDGGVVSSKTTPTNNGENFTVAIKLDPKNVLIFPTVSENLMEFVVNNSPLLLLFLPGLAMFLVWYKKGRDWRFDSPNAFDLDPGQPQRLRPLFEPINIPMAYEPLKNLTPGEAGLMIDERVDNQDVVAEIVDLARKKYLSIERVENKGFLKFGHDYLFTKLKDGSENLPTQQEYLMKHIFSSKNQIKLSELKGIFYTHMTKVKELIVVQLKDRKMFTSNPSNARGLGMALAILLSVGVFIATISTLVFLESFWSVGILLVSVVSALYFAWNMPQKTAVGNNLSLQAKGLRETIRLGKWREEIKEKHLFTEEVLPFAISLGVIGKLAKDMAQLNIEPPKYMSGGFTGNTLVWSGFVNDFSSSAAGGLGSNPSSSSSGGSGFSGGFSGGGGGGGGGGSW